jgi:hypothetical protein
MAKKKEKTEVEESVEEILRTIIDDWYERVSGYYVTQDDAEGQPELEETVQLKRFHDSKGHRIKFNKDDLDFTYGLRSDWQKDSVLIEVSVNNKVDNFDYEDFREQLFLHYKKVGGKKVEKPRAIGDLCFDDVFQLESGISEVFTVEKHENKADIMRLSFRMESSLLTDLLGERLATKQLIESYCVSPFRSIYARVYRSNTS